MFHLNSSSVPHQSQNSAFFSKMHTQYYVLFAGRIDIIFFYLDSFRHHWHLSGEVWSSFHFWWQQKYKLLPVIKRPSLSLWQPTVFPQQRHTSFSGHFTHLLPIHYWFIFKVLCTVHWKIFQIEQSEKNKNSRNAFT